ncbi:MAG TPA: DUF2272 domain-containing protein [Methylosinus sp.]|jgi:hypothetical protein
MTYKSDFEDDSGWSVADTNVRLLGRTGEDFRRFLRESDVGVVIRYYASSARSKTITKEEAQRLSDDGFYVLPVFQDRNRAVADFGAVNGAQNALSALQFAEGIGQPRGSAILFAADEDFESGDIARYLIPYFEEIKAQIGGRHRIGAYGSGLVLSTLLQKGLIEIPWLSMSRAFRGTQNFFYSSDWAMRQVPPDRVHGPTGVTYDRNVSRRTPAELGAFRLGALIAEAEDAHLGEARFVSSGASSGPVNAYVRTEGLNFRKAADPDAEIIRALTIGEPVVDRGPADAAGWRRVAIAGQEGFVFGRYLREPQSPEIEALIAKLVAEWVRFGKGAASEKVDPYAGYVGQMWASIGLSYDGRSKYPNGKDVPWSAAFISYVVRNAGPKYRKFAFAASHSAYSNDAIRAAILGRRDKPFWGFRPSAAKPEIGDIIHRNRDGGSVTFDYAENHSEFESHADIVVEVTPAVARVIGGNVGNTVSMRRIDQTGDDIQEYSLDANGYIAPGQSVIAILKNRAADVI